MTQSFFRGLGAIGLAMALATPAVAQISTRTDNTAYGGTSGEFMLLGAGARGAALGGAYAALATDVTALYYNPGGLAQLPRPEKDAPPVVGARLQDGPSGLGVAGKELGRADTEPARQPKRLVRPNPDRLAVVAQHIRCIATMIPGGLNELVQNPSLLLLASLQARWP